MRSDDRSWPIRLADLNKCYDSCNYLGIDSSTDNLDRYSNLFLNAYINRHVHAQYLKMI